MVKRTLERKTSPHVFGVHILAEALFDDLAARHDEVVIGERFGEIVVLLDQQHGHLAALGERGNHVADIFDDRRLMPSVGSSRIRIFGSAASARPIASCCCWPPERSPPRRCSMSFSTGNMSKIRAGTLLAPDLGASPIKRFSSTVTRGKISRPCGT